ncbi:DeoR/GlpR family DNA-binding transcription regulator [Kocuria sp. HSID16901]|uniref:DeoR/GlpR family DNA-binding transcription regulator n=1 Tax=Kocuria sp. HSID16901 TaxID=2419505 RepID=UPI0006614244|nr:DeoR/GlpR family DNA-binding transcription regulator [Kocuria sp. HSID16901]MCT1368098.1 DeoR/GlpR family DNA-binding transcription regulator [Rothia sp. p3-SID1597]
MLAEERRKLIVREVQKHGTVHVQVLAENLNVSPMTVRRDLADLDEQGLLNRIHGGAESTKSTLEPAYADKMSRNAGIKAGIAQRAAEMVSSDQSLGFSAGTTCTRLAQELTSRADISNLTIVTNSLPVAEEFFTAEHSAAGNHPDNPHHVLLTGGQRTPSDALVGPVADLALTNLHVDTLFIGAHGAGISGLTTPNLAEARTNRALIESARTVVAIFDHSKWGTTGLAGFADWPEVDVVVTDSGLPAVAHDFLEDNVNKVVISS